MNWNEHNKIIIEKADFYRANELKAHVLTIPKGTYKNGKFVSKLEQDKFFWFLERGKSIAIRIFLSEIYDIIDLKEKGQ